MKKIIFIFLILFVSKISFGQKTVPTLTVGAEHVDRIFGTSNDSIEAKNDSLLFRDFQTNTNIIVSRADYLSEINSIFKDSIKYSILKRINSLSNNFMIERNYYVDLDYYDRYIHPKFFDEAFLNLLKKNKLLILKNGVYVKMTGITTKVIRIYCCKKTAHIYCGKDWGLFYNKELLTSFHKNRNRQAYAVRSCF